jgi:hypothetical protein
VLDVPVQAGRRRFQANPEFHQLREAMRRDLSRKLANPILPRKTSSEFLWCSYRKLTQVGKENILRRLSDLSLRNSAK